MYHAEGYLKKYTKEGNLIEEGIVTFNFQVAQAPLFGSIRAGEPLNEENINFIGYEVFDFSLYGGYEVFALLAPDDSMIGARIQKNDVVFISKCKYPGSIISINVLTVGNSPAILRRVLLIDDKIMLFSSNNSVLPETVDLKDINILGQVIEVKQRLEI